MRVKPITLALSRPEIDFTEINRIYMQIVYFSLLHSYFLVIKKKMAMGQLFVERVLILKYLA